MRKHSDCMNFCAVDATKGICRLSKQMINLDDAKMSRDKSNAKM